MVYLKRTPTFRGEIHTHLTRGGRFIEIIGPMACCPSPYCQDAAARKLRAETQIATGVIEQLGWNGVA